MRKVPVEMERAITRDNLGGLTRDEAAEKLSKMFGVELTEKQLFNLMHRLHISQGAVGMKSQPGRSIEWPDGLAEYIRSLQPGMHWAECYEKSVERFGLDRKRISLEVFKAYAKRHGITNGIDCRFDSTTPRVGRKMSQEQYKKCKPTMFKPGNRPKNELPVGSVVRATDGRWKKKISGDRVPARRNWEYCHRIIWEEANGPIPKGFNVIFLDGDYDNLSLDNLALVSNAELQYINKKGLVSGAADITKTGIALAKLYHTMKRKEEK